MIKFKLCAAAGLLALLLGAIPSAAHAQGCGSNNPNCIVPTAPNGTSDGRAASTKFVQNQILAGLPLPSGKIYIGSAGGLATPQAFSGDGQLSIAGVFTLLSVNSNIGSFGAATQCTSFTVNAKGLITAAAAVTCTPAIASVTGLGTGVAAALANALNGTGGLVGFSGALGTPTSGVATNLTGTAAGLTAGHVTTNANLTGAITSSGNATSLGSFTSANLAGALTDETGSGAAVFATSPTLVTPNLGVATATTINGASIDNLPWTTFTPSFTFTGGSGNAAVSPVGAYKQLGKTLHIRVFTTITFTSTPSNISFPLPNSFAGVAAQIQALPCYNPFNGITSFGQIAAGASTVISTGLVTATDQPLNCEGIIEIQ